jgi:Tfp pilus assembly protein PilO
MEKPIFYLTIILITLAVVGIFLVYPLYSETTILKNKLNDRREALANKNIYFSKLRELKDEVSKFSEELEKIKSALPDNSDVIDIVSFMISEASANGLSLDNIGISDYSLDNKKSNSEVKKSSLSIAVSGRYQSLKSFISSIQKNSRLFEIDNISLEGSSANEQSGTKQEKTSREDYFKFNITLSFSHY